MNVSNVRFKNIEKELAAIATGKNLKAGGR